jgi:transposase
MGARRILCRVLVGKPEGKRQPGRPRLDGRIILRWIFRKGYVGPWTESICLRTGRRALVNEVMKILVP